MVWTTFVHNLFEEYILCLKMRGGGSIASSHLNHIMWVCTETLSQTGIIKEEEVKIVLSQCKADSSKDFHFFSSVNVLNILF